MQLESGLYGPCSTRIPIYSIGWFRSPLLIEYLLSFDEGTNWQCTLTTAEHPTYNHPLVNNSKQKKKKKIHEKEPLLTCSRFQWLRSHHDTAGWLLIDEFGVGTCDGIENVIKSEEIVPTAFSCNVKYNACQVFESFIHVDSPLSATFLNEDSV